MYRVYVSGPEEYIIEYIHKNQCTKTINLQNVYYIPKKKEKKIEKQIIKITFAEHILFLQFASNQVMKYTFK